MKKHYYYIDYLRFFAMIGVVYLHIASILLNGNRIAFGSIDWELLNFFLSFAYSAVALFFMISGCLLLSDERTADVSLLLKKRLPRLGVPLIAWTAVAALWIGHLADDYSIAGFLARFLPGICDSIMMHFWFAFSIIALYLVSPFLYKGLNAMDSRACKLVFALIVIYQGRALLGQLLPEELYRYLNFTLIDKLDPTEGILSIFILGWYLGNTKNKIPNTVLVLAASALAIGICLASRGHVIAAGDYESPYHNQTMGMEVWLAACIFMLLRQNVKAPCKLLAVWPVLPFSYAIYFFHVIVMELFFGLGWLPGSFPETVLFTAANIILCYLLIKTAASIRPLCYAAIGVKYADACKSCNWQYSIARLKKAPR